MLDWQALLVGDRLEKFRVHQAGTQRLVIGSHRMPGGAVVPMPPPNPS